MALFLSLAGRSVPKRIVFLATPCVESEQRPPHCGQDRGGSVSIQASGLHLSEHPLQEDDRLLRSAGVSLR